MTVSDSCRKDFLAPKESSRAMVQLLVRSALTGDELVVLEVEPAMTLGIKTWKKNQEDKTLLKILKKRKIMKAGLVT